MPEKRGTTERQRTSSDQHSQYDELVNRKKGYYYRIFTMVDIQVNTYG